MPTCKKVALVLDKGATHINNYEPGGLKNFSYENKAGAITITFKEGPNGAPKTEEIMGPKAMPEKK